MNSPEVAVATTLGRKIILGSKLERQAIHKYKVFIPIFGITRMGLVQDVPIEWSIQAFIESLELPSGCGPVLKARRLNRKQVVDGTTSWVPTQSVVLTIRARDFFRQYLTYCLKKILVLYCSESNQIKSKILYCTKIKHKYNNIYNFNTVQRRPYHYK